MPVLSGAGEFFPIKFGVVSVKRVALFSIVASVLAAALFGLFYPFDRPNVPAGDASNVLQAINIFAPVERMRVSPTVRAACTVVGWVTLMVALLSAIAFRDVNGSNYDHFVAKRPPKGHNGLGAAAVFILRGVLYAAFMTAIVIYCMIWSPNVSPSGQVGTAVILASQAAKAVYWTWLTRCVLSTVLIAMIFRQFCEFADFARAKGR